MKITFIRPLNPFFESSASGNRFSSIIKGLQSQGIQISLIITGGYNHPAEYQQMGKKKSIDGITVYYTFCTFNHSIWWRRFNTYLFYSVFSFINTIKIRFLLSKINYDYIWITKDLFNMNYILHHKKEIPGKVIIELNEFNDIHKGIGRSINKIQWAKAEKANKAFLAAIPNIDLFAIMTQTLIRHYEQMANPSAKFFHLPMTVDLDRFENTPKQKPTKAYIAFAGTLLNAKDGADILIKSFANIASQYPDLEVKLAGWYHPDIAIQKQIIADHGLEDRVHYLGLINKEQIPDFLVNATVLVLPRPDSHQAQGGFPTKLGEYLATGNPVCVTKVGEIPDYLTDNISAFMATPGDVDSFTNALQRALSDPENAHKVGMIGREVAEEHFNMRVQASRLKTFLEENLN